MISEKDCVKTIYDHHHELIRNKYFNFQAIEECLKREKLDDLILDLINKIYQEKFNLGSAFIGILERLTLFGWKLNRSCEVDITHHDKANKEFMNTASEEMKTFILETYEILHERCRKHHEIEVRENDFKRRL